jgi:hypothetical protein
LKNCSSADFKFYWEILNTIHLPQKNTLFNPRNQSHMLDEQVQSTEAPREVKNPPLAESIVNYLEMKTTGALFLTGDWGSGKTYYLKNTIFPLVEEKTKYIPLIVSLYGETDKQNIANKVLFAFLDKRGEHVKLSTGTVAKNLKNLSDSIPFIKKYVDIEKIITGTGDNAFRLLPHDKLLICFDDIERMSEKLKVDDFLGIVNELVENKGCKVLLIANEEEIKNGITYKEKTIEKTIHFLPEIGDIFGSIVNAYPDNNFKTYLKRNRDYFIKTFTHNEAEGNENKILKKSFSNIRTLKFALEHFRIPFEILVKGKEIDEIVSIKLRNIWVFTLSISIEFRKPNNISFTDRKKLDVATNTLSFKNLDNLNIPNKKLEKETTVRNEWSFSEEFKKLYYVRASEIYIFYPELYDLITSGKEIDIESFVVNVDESFKIKEGKVNPAHQILNTLMKGFWTFTDDGFKEALTDLLDYCEKGELEDVVSYLNSGVYLFEFNDIVGVGKDEIVSKIQTGLSILLPKVKWNEFFKSQFEMVRENFSTEHLQQLVIFIEAKVEEFEMQNALQKVQSLERMLKDDIGSLVHELLPNNPNFRVPDKPIFHLLDQNIIQNSISNWLPKDIMDLTSILKFRYIDTGFGEKLVEEIVFLDGLEKGISKLDFTDNTLSKHLLQNQLRPRIVECKKKLAYYRSLH